MLSKPYIIISEKIKNIITCLAKTSSEYICGVRWRLAFIFLFIPSKDHYLNFFVPLDTCFCVEYVENTQ